MPGNSARQEMEKVILHLKLKNASQVLIHYDHGQISGMYFGVQTKIDLWFCAALKSK